MFKAKVVGGERKNKGNKANLCILLPMLNFNRVKPDVFSVLFKSGLVQG